MARFVVLRADARAGAEPDGAVRIVRDGFSVWAFIVPAIWFLVNRMWFAAALAFAAQMVLGFLGAVPGLAIVAAFASLLLGFLIGCDANDWHARALVSRGWKWLAVIEADSRNEAEIKLAFLPHAASVARASAAARPVATDLLLTARS